MTTLALTMPITVFCVNTASVVNPLFQVSYIHQSMEYTCTVCNRQFAFPLEFSTHQTIHSEEKKYKCQYPRCNREYKTKAEYHRHYKMHSPSSNNYKCLVFKKAFKKEKYLWEDKQVHTDELPFACDHCGVEGIIISRQNTKVKKV